MWVSVNATWVALRTGPSINDERVTDSFFDDVGRLLEEQDTPAGRWAKLMLLTKNDGRWYEGWMKRGLLIEGAAPPPVFEFSIANFLSTCIDAELAINADASVVAPYYILADYLIALAYMETKIADLPLPDDLGGAVGPFKLTQSDWDRVRNANVLEDLQDLDRLSPLMQCYGAAILTRLDIAALSAAAMGALMDPGADDGAGPYIPSLSEVYMARLVGHEGAHALRVANEVDVAHNVLQQVLDNDAMIALTARDWGVLEDEQDQKRTVAAAWNAVEARLNESLKEAFSLVSKHLPDDVPKPTGVAPWLTVARAEAEFWNDAANTITSNSGKARIGRYFSATDYQPDTVKPWCGAAIAFCMREAGFQDNIPAGAAAASSWEAFGDVALTRILKAVKPVPEGAVVVLSPAEGSGRTGHVGLFEGFNQDKTRVKLLGGNQSSTFKVSSFPIGKVVSVRWLNDVPLQDMPPAPGDGLTSLLNLIGKGELGAENFDNYNARFGKAANALDPNFTQLTIRQVLRWQQGRSFSACGRYQFIRKTLNGLAKRSDVDMDSLFDEAMQDRLALILLERRKYLEFIGNRISLESFARNLAMEWASLPVLAATQGHKRKVKIGQSYYAGDGINKAQLSASEVRLVLSQLTQPH